MRKAAAPPPPRPFNGTGSGSSSISAEDSDSVSGESLEGRMELTVYLPGEKVFRTSVERRTPMMDLLVQVTKANNLSPGGYILKLTSDNNRDPPPYKPSTAIGSLSCNIIYVVPKSLGRDSTIPRKDSKMGSLQPFEKTFRLRIHLPRNQLHVLRVSPNTPLVDVFRAICMDRELTASKYELRHPIHREERLDPQRCLTDYGLSEVAIVAVKDTSSTLSRSSSDIMALQHDEDRKKRSFFGFFKKNKSSIGDTSSDGHSSRGVSPARSDNSEIQSISPPPSNAEIPVVNRRTPKKKAAPPPPLLKPPAPKPPPVSPTSNVSVVESGDLTTAITHSRNSSDSSGYHEASILSDSPESGNGLDTTDRRRHRIVSAQSECKVATVNGGPAPSNLTLANSTSSLSVVSTGTKKRKAPAPPPLVSPVSAPSVDHSSPSPPLNHSFTHPLKVSTLSSNNVNGNVPNSATSKFPNVHEELQVVGNGRSRSSSNSSKASSFEEVEEEKIVSAVPPQPVPRQSKPVVSQSPIKLEDEKQEMNVNEVIEKHNARDDDTSLSSRRTSTSSTISRSSKCDEFPQLNTDAQRISDISEDVEMNPSSISSEVVKNLENSRRSSESSSTSRSSVTKIIDSVEVDLSGNDNRHRVNSNESLTLHVNNMADSKRESKNEVSVQTNFDLDSVPPPLECVDELNGSVTESVASSRNSSFTDETRSVSNSQQQLSVDNPVKGGRDLSDFYDEVPDPINDINQSSINLNDFHNQFNISRQSITSRWGRLVSLPNIELPDFSSRGISNLAESDEEQDSSLGDNDSLIDADDDSVPCLDVKASPFSHVNGFSRNESIDSTDSWRPQQVDEENNILDTNARLDLDAVIEKVFATVDQSEETPLDEYRETNNENFDSVDEGVDTWEYTIPEVPPPPQFDYENFSEIPQVPPPPQFDNEPLNGSESFPDVLCEVPLEFQNISPDVVTEFNNNNSASISEGEKVHHSNSQETFSMTDELTKNETVNKMEESNVVSTSEVISEISPPVQEKVRVIYRRPIVKFSIATYKARDSDEVSYQNKLSKAESFSVRSTDDNGEETRVTKYESSSLPRATTFREKPNVESVSGQSKAIAGAIAAPVPVEDKLDTAENEVILRSKEGLTHGPLRRAQSEMQLDKGNEIRLADSSQVHDVTDQDKLQNEYQKLHDQFMQWQQQLMQNQAVLQQQKIAPESTTETLQRVQELQQQFSSLPPLKESSIEIVERESEVKMNLNGKKPDVTSTVTQSQSNTNSLERRAPRIGPKPWRPASVSITAWNPKRNMNEYSSNEMNDKINNNNSPVIVTNSNVTSARGSVASINKPITDKPVIHVNRSSSQATAATFPKWPVVKGFVLDPQPKSKVVLNSEKTATAPKATFSKPLQSTGSVEIKIANVNIKPAVATIEIEEKSSNKGYANGSAYNNHINKNQSAEASKKFTTVVNLAQKQHQPMSSPPPPPPPSSIPPAAVKTVQKQISLQRSVSSNSSEGGRDELMSAIKDFGGRTGLRKVSSSDASWQKRYGNAY